MPRFNQTLLERKHLKLLASGEVIDAREEELIFISTQGEISESATTQTFHLKGKWSLNSQNELRFRANCSPKSLTLSGSWKMSPLGELTYTYRKNLEGNTLLFQTLTFRGVWRLSPDYRLNFIFEGSERSLKFSGRLVRFRDVNGRGEIHYELGADFRYSLKKAPRETLVLFGRWRPISELELGFEIEAPSGEPYILTLKGNYRFGGKNQIEFSLSRELDEAGTKLSVALKRKIFKNNGEIFLRGTTDLDERHSLLAGAKINW